MLNLLLFDLKLFFVVKLEALNYLFHSVEYPNLKVFFLLHHRVLGGLAAEVGRVTPRSPARGGLQRKVRVVFNAMLSSVRLSAIAFSCHGTFALVPLGEDASLEA